MSFFKRRSEVEMVVSDDHAPLRVPPDDVAVSATLPPTVISMPLLYRMYVDAPPNFIAPLNDKSQPKRANDRSDNELPKCTKSNTDIENTEPRRAKPCTDTELPTRPNDRSDNELPKCKKSNTDIENTEPKPAYPCTDN
jgi:hypothetical protein